MKKKIEKFFGRIVGWICCIWLIIWIIPMVICGFMIDILMAFFGIEKESQCINNLAIWLGKVAANLKNNNKKEEQETVKENE